MLKHTASSALHPDTFSPEFDCVVFFDGDVWHACVDVGGAGDLASQPLLEDYSLCHRFASFGGATCLSFSVNIYDDGKLLSICVPASSHGTHVASIAAGHFPDESARDGQAPGAQILSLKIADTRMQTFESALAVHRALSLATARGCHVINMSYGEDSVIRGGALQEAMARCVTEHNVCVVTSAGNRGPALGTVTAPGGASSHAVGVAAMLSETMKKSLFSMLPGNLHDENNDEKENNDDSAFFVPFTFSSRGPTLDGDNGVVLSAPGSALASVAAHQLSPVVLKSGTSMAAPSVAGALACVRSGVSLDRHVSVAALVRAATNTAAHVADKDDDGAAALMRGSGLVDAQRAHAWLRDHVDDPFAVRTI